MALTIDAAIEPAFAAAARGLVCRYGRQMVLDEVSFELAGGRTLAVMGQNGAGKSTLLALLAGVQRPSAGGIEVFGCDTPWREPGLRRRIGYLAQRPALYPDLTVEEHLHAAARLFGVDPKAAIARAVAEHELDGVRRRLASRLSGGYRQRLGVAMALIHRPELVLLDEPAAAMDPGQRETLHQRIAGLSGTRTVIFTSHRVEEALDLADHILVLYRGRCVSFVAGGSDDGVALVRMAGAVFPELECVEQRTTLADGRYRLQLRPGCTPAMLMAALAEADMQVGSVVSGREARTATLLRQITEGRA